MEKDKNYKLKKAIIVSNKEVLSDFKPLDKEEEEVFKKYEEEKLEDIELSDDVEEFRKAQNEYKKEQKNQTMTLRINSEIREKIKELSKNIGLNYQTFINMILYQIANEKIKVEVKNA
jgi:predicted DNA binding CopG/RHH family protein